MVSPKKIKVKRESADEKSFKAADRIYEIACRKGVTIVLLDDEDSDLVKIDQTYTFEAKNKILKVNVLALEKINKNILLELYRRVFNTGEVLFKASKEPVLNSYNHYSAENSDKQILAFFKSIIPPNDYQALKLSLFLRFESNKGYNISSFKTDIRERFGDRGANIANLCSAGYFEGFMQLYNEVPETEFLEYYQMVVGEKARALFVHSSMDSDDIEKRVNEMVNKAIKYHMDDFRIHGKGQVNFENLKNFVASRSPKDDGYIIKRVYENLNIPAVEYMVQMTRH